MVCVRALLLAAIVALPLAARAEAPEPVPISERDFIARVLAASPQLELIAARVDAARAEIADARVRPNPSLGVTREDVAGVAETIASVDVPLDLSGRRGLRVRAAEHAVAAASAQGDLERELLVIDALDVYYDAAWHRLRAQVLRDSRASLAKIVDVIRTRKAAGEASGYDLERLELELGQYDDTIVEAELELGVARRRLATLAGARDPQLDASDALEIMAPQQLDVSALARARGDYRGALLRVDAAASELAAANRAWVPVLVLTGGVKTSESSTFDLGYVAGVSLDIPLFDRGQGLRARSRARMREHRAQALSIEREVSLALSAATDELTRRTSHLATYRQVQLARVPSLLRRAEVTYREGDRPIVEVLDAYRAAREVALREVELQHLAKRAELRLMRARGHR
jgi:outer membrane protein, heavy metal efflux system